MEGNIARARASLQDFVKTHIPEADISCVDDIVLGYVVDVLSGMRDEEEESFDVDQFVEMIAAYIPEFASVDSTAVCEWIFQMASAKPTEPSQENISFDHEPEPLAADELLKNGLVSPPTSDSGDGSPPPFCSPEQPADPNDLNGSCNRERKESENSDSCPDAVELLLEMFPDVSIKVVRHHLKKHRGDVDLTIQVLLELSRTTQNHSSKKMENIEAAVPITAHDTSIKENVLARYEFVDVKQYQQHHKPILPKQEPKKMVRYRDNKVVSTKGERYTMETKQDSEAMKKTYVSLKPLRKYRFH